MDEKQLQVFINGATRYFTEVTGLAAEVGTPYLVDDEKQAINEFTGMIGISGNTKGAVYFSSPRSLLMLLLAQVGETNHSVASMLDLVGDIANTISGNARNHFGANFMISVPITVAGVGDIRFPKTTKSYAIPVIWKNFKAMLVVSLDL
jgi:chemotaxis protein CheX